MDENLIYEETDYTWSFRIFSRIRLRTFEEESAIL